MSNEAQTDCEQWKTGEPPAQGWYDCRLKDGTEVRLRWWICVMNPKKRYWKDTQGTTRGFSYDIEWCGDPGVSAW